MPPWRQWYRGHHAIRGFFASASMHQAGGGSAMVYMFAAMTLGSFGPLTRALIVYFASVAAWSALAAACGLATGVVNGVAAGPTLQAAVLAPPVVSLCHSAMAISMVECAPGCRRCGDPLRSPDLGSGA